MGGCDRYSAGEARGKYAGESGRIDHLCILLHA